MSIYRGAVLRFLAVAALLSIGVVGCRGRQHVRGYDCAELAKRHFRESRQTTIAEYGDYDTERQFAIYICGTQYIHPPMLEIAPLLAREGEEVVEFLKARLLEADDEASIVDIVLVFTEMEIQQTYDVSGADDIMMLMADKVDRISNQHRKQLMEQAMKEIQRESAGGRSRGVRVNSCVHVSSGFIQHHHLA